MAFFFESSRYIPVGSISRCNHPAAALISLRNSWGGGCGSSSSLHAKTHVLAVLKNGRNVHTLRERQTVFLKVWPKIELLSEYGTRNSVLAPSPRRSAPFALHSMAIPRGIGRPFSFFPRSPRSILNRRRPRLWRAPPPPVMQ